mmetsp:Transcript_18398/g.26410  ORF Transcript_18398/g.26410 Transcript_18398/m.26410 type:complete len:86 (+) Transcript_18398:428-685(+)
MVHFFKQINNSIMLGALTSLGRSAAFSTGRSAFVANGARVNAVRSIGSTMVMNAEEGQAEVVLVGCGAPNRGMGWYHAVQMIDKK